MTAKILETSRTVCCRVAIFDHPEAAKLSCLALHALQHAASEATIHQKRRRARFLF